MGKKNPRVEPPSVSTTRTLRRFLTPEQPRPRVARERETMDAHLESLPGGRQVRGRTPSPGHSDPRGEGERTLIIQMEEMTRMMPTKSELSEMFSKLEQSLKTDIKELRGEVAHLLQRVEDNENRMDRYAAAIATIQKQLHSVAQTQRIIQYRLEDQENRGRRKNLRIRGLSESITDAELVGTVQNIFNAILSRPATSEIIFDRVHRIMLPRGFSKETTRDIICRFHYYTDKESILNKLRHSPPVEYEGEKIQIFSDLARGTLMRRRALRPLLDILRGNEIQYRWGYPAGLIARKHGKTVILRYPEELIQFCENLEIQVPLLPEWSETLPRWEPLADPLYEKKGRKQHTQML